jgi:hypothetical protein
MIALHGYRLFWRERAAHRDTRDGYDNLVVAHQAALAREEKLHASLREALDIAEAQGDMCRQLEAERDDARREVDDVRAALCWLEDKWFKKGGVA